MARDQGSLGDAPGRSCGIERSLDCDFTGLSRNVREARPAALTDDAKEGGEVCLASLVAIGARQSNGEVEPRKDAAGCTGFHEAFDEGWRRADWGHRCDGPAIASHCRGCPPLLW